MGRRAISAKLTRSDFSSNVWSRAVESATISSKPVSYVRRRWECDRGSTLCLLVAEVAGTGG